MREPDEERWARRYGESFMDWKPREERSYLGTYSMGIGSPRAAYQRVGTIYGQQSRGFYQLDVSRSAAGTRATAGRRCPATSSRSGTAPGAKVQFERFPTNWGLPRARIVESTCAARGADACRWDVRWKNPSRGARFWTPSLAAAGGSALARPPDAAPPGAGPSMAAAPLPLLAGVALGYALREGDPAPPHPAPPRSPVRGDHLLEPRAGEEVRRARDADRAALAPHRPQRRGERDARSREDLRPGAEPARPPDGVPEGLPVPGGPRAPRAARAPDGGRRRGGLPFEGVEIPLEAEASAGARAAITGQPVLRQRRGADDRARPPGAGPHPSGAELRRGAAARARAGVRGAHRDRGGAGALRPGRRGPAHRGGQPRRPRHRQGRELPDHRGSVPQPRGQGAGPHRAAPGHQRGAAEPPTATSRPRSSSSSSARRWPRSASSWPASPTS